MIAAIWGGAALTVVTLTVVVVVYGPRHTGRHARLRLARTDHAHVVTALQTAVRLHAELGAQLGVLADRIGEPK